MSSLSLPQALQPLQPLFQRSPPPPLAPSKPFNPSLTPAIDALSSQYPPSVIAGLHLLNDDIARAHEVAQAHEGEGSADVWHAWLHRREGDYWNSSWWLSRVSHPLLLQLANTTSLPRARQEAKSFVSACEKVGKGRSEGDKLEEMQYEQMKRLVLWDVEGKGE